MFNKPQIQYFQMLHNFFNFIHSKHSKNCSQILELIFIELMTTTLWSQFCLNEILARFGRKRAETNEKQGFWPESPKSSADLFPLISREHVIKERLLKIHVYAGLRHTADVNLYDVTKFSPYFPFTIQSDCFYAKKKGIYASF